MKANKAQQGFSLIELMIAVTLALVAMLAATQLYASTRQTYRLQGHADAAFGGWALCLVDAAASDRSGGLSSQSCDADDPDCWIHVSGKWYVSDSDLKRVGNCPFYRGWNQHDGL